MPGDAAPLPTINRTATVADIPDAELLRRAVASARPKSQARAPRWVAVMETFALGSTYAAQLCRRFGLNPDDEMRRRR